MNTPPNSLSLSDVRAGETIFVRTHEFNEIGDVVIYVRSSPDGLTFSLSPKVTATLAWPQVFECSPIKR